MPANQRGDGNAGAEGASDMILPWTLDVGAQWKMWPNHYFATESENSRSAGRRLNSKAISRAGRGRRHCGVIGGDPMPNFTPAVMPPPVKL